MKAFMTITLSAVLLGAGGRVTTVAPTMTYLEPEAIVQGEEFECLDVGTLPDACWVSDGLEVCMSADGPGHLEVVDLDGDQAIQAMPTLCMDERPVWTMFVTDVEVQNVQLRTTRINDQLAVHFWFSAETIGDYTTGYRWELGEGDTYNVGFGFNSGVAGWAANGTVDNLWVY